MAKFRKKPVVIEAVQYTGRNGDDIGIWIGASIHTRERRNNDD